MGHPQAKVTEVVEQGNTENYPVCLYEGCIAHTINPSAFNTTVGTGKGCEANMHLS